MYLSCRTASTRSPLWSKSKTTDLVRFWMPSRASLYTAGTVGMRKPSSRLVGERRLMASRAKLEVLTTNGASHIEGVSW